LEQATPPAKRLGKAPPQGFVQPPPFSGVSSRGWRLLKGQGSASLVERRQEEPQQTQRRSIGL
jgi:hypothetical protein